MGRPWRSKQSKAWQPAHLPRSYHGKGLILMDIYGYLFYIAAKDKKTVSQNSGVCIEVLDKRKEQSTPYFGAIDDVWEVHYGSNIQIPVFRCHWVKHPKSVEVNGYGFIIVDLNNVNYKDGTWILALHVAKVM